MLVEFADPERLAAGLVECLGKKQASFLARAITMDFLSNILKIPNIEISLAFPPGNVKQDYEDFISLYMSEEKEKEIKRKLSGVRALGLQGKSICECTKKTAEHIMKNESGALLIIRPVSPLIDPFLMMAALKLLRLYQVVIGPTFDGGFYLMGCNNYYPRMFEYSTDECKNIYKSVIANLNRENLIWQELEISYSVEGPVELNQLYDDIESLRLAGDDVTCYHTERCLMNLRDVF